MKTPNFTPAASILPRDAGAAPLDIVIGVMAFLAALALGASLIADRAAEGWRAGLAGRLTVQILPSAQGGADPSMKTETAAALSVLDSTPGILRAQAVSEKEALNLVEPWLGSGALIAELPLPRLVDATIVPGAGIDFALLARRLKAAAPDASLDDHSRWIARLKKLADSVVWSAYGILALIAVATAAAVAFATRAGLGAHHDIVALLHLMGAQSGFVSRAFERHYFLSAVVAAACGSAMAGVLFVAAGGLELAGIAPLPFLPPLALRPAELTWLLAIPAMSGSIAWATARLSVLAVLRRIY